MVALSWAQVSSLGQQSSEGSCIDRCEHYVDKRLRKSAYLILTHLHVWSSEASCLARAKTLADKKRGKSTTVCIVK